MKRILGIFVAVFAMVVASVYGLSSPQVSAETSSSALSISPKKNYVVTPGQVIEDTLRIKNLDKTKALSITFHVIDFTYTDDSGTPKLILNKGEAAERPTAWSLRPYLKTPETTTIKPGETKTVDISLDMPKDQGPGSYYSAIIYSTGSASGANVGLSASGTTLVFANVPGPVNESLALKEFGAYLGKTESDNGFKKFTMQKPKQIAYTLKNDGNVVENPVGSITYKYMFGKEQEITDVNPNGSLALIGQARTFISCIKLKVNEDKPNEQQSRVRECEDKFLWPGLYTMSLDLYYGQNGNNTREVVGTSYFWYLPWWFLVPFLIIVAILIIVIWRFVNKVRDSMYGPKTKAKHRKK